MKKKLIVTLVTVFVALTPAMSQVFITPEEEWNNNRAGSDVPLGVVVAEQDVEYDQFVPVGSGMLILGCLGGAYLLGKRRKDDAE